MSQTITGSHTTTQTLTSANATIATGASVIANGNAGTYTVKLGGTPALYPVSGAVFAPASRGSVTIHNNGFINATGPDTLGPLDLGIVIGATGTVFNTGTILGHSGIGMFGTTGTDYINNSKIIYGTYGAGIYTEAKTNLINSGTITGTGTNATSGIILHGGGTITNQAGGTIAAFVQPGGTSTAYAIQSSAGSAINNNGVILGSQGVNINSGTVVNTGTIKTAGYDVLFQYGGYLSNSSTGQIISTTTNAFYAAIAAQANSSLATATIINAGTITNISNIAIQLRDGGSVNNSGLIAASTTLGSNANAAGIYISSEAGVANNIINTGAIRGNNAIVVDPRYNATGPITAYIKNTGQLTAISTYNNGSLIENGSGILLNNGSQSISGTVVNSGTINASSAGIVFASGTGGITNTSTGKISGGSGYGIQIAGGSITNAGTITATEYGVKAISSAAGITNSGLILATGGKFLNTNQGNSFTAYAAGINLLYGGTITNLQGGSIIGNNGADLSGGGLLNNQGFIAGTAFASAIFVGQGGTIINAGSIQAQHAAGIYAYSGTLTVNNTGKITADYGITLRDGATITNAGTIIAADQGVGQNTSFATTIANNIINSGLIKANATFFAGVGIFTGRTFVGAGMAVDGGNITNTSHGTLIAGGDGIIAYTQPATITNAGTIIAGITGIALVTGGSVNNTGSISGTSGIYSAANTTLSVTNSNEISGRYFGVLAEGAATVTNSGSISVSATSFVLNGTTLNGSGISILNGGTAVNNAGATINADVGIYMKAVGGVTNKGDITGTYGIDIHGGGQVTNFGTITATNLAVYGGASSTIINTGTIEGTGTIYNYHGTALPDFGVNLANGGNLDNQAGGVIIGALGAYLGKNSTFTNAGTIIGHNYGAVDFATATANRLIINPGAAFTGTANIGGGVIELASTSTTGTLSGLGTQFINAATITIDQGANWTITGPTTITAGQTLADDGTITFNGAVTNAGLITADPATIIFNSAVTGPGTIDVNAGDTIIFNASVASTETIDFLSNTGTIVINDPSAFNATIIGTGVEVIACFATGTHILTPRGQIPVEHLNPGDLVITADGTDAPIKWIGRRRLTLTNHPNPEKAQPIRIAAGAIANNIPARDLLLSPDHALYFQNHLIPAKALINHRNVTQLTRHQITYYHIELASHAIIFAENTAVETYLETGNRACFENAGPLTTLYPDFGPTEFQAMREAQSCYPLCESGPVHTRLRTTLIERALNTHPHSSLRGA